jgi:hypothetical protein
LDTFGWEKEVLAELASIFSPSDLLAMPCRSAMLTNLAMLGV